MNLTSQIMSHLSDGCFHSGTKLGQLLGVSRAAVWKSMKELRRQGFNVYAVSGKGYRLAMPDALLSSDVIRDSLSQALNFQVNELFVFSEIDSTNSYLMRLAKQEPLKHSGAVCLSESQSNGRGRLGRQWISPFGENLYFSFLHTFNLEAGKLNFLSLAIGVSIIEALREVGVEGIGLKWPNDILFESKKVGGVLIEVLGDVQGPCDVIIGIGLNCFLSDKERLKITQPATSLASIMGGVSRNKVAASLIKSCFVACQVYELGERAAFFEKWCRYDAFKNKSIELELYGGTVKGLYLGINEKGGLLLERHGTVETYSSGIQSIKERV